MINISHELILYRLTPYMPGMSGGYWNPQREECTSESLYHGLTLRGWFSCFTFTTAAFGFPFQAVVRFLQNALANLDFNFQLPNQQVLLFSTVFMFKIINYQHQNEKTCPDKHPRKQPSPRRVLQNSHIGIAGTRQHARSPLQIADNQQFHRTRPLTRPYDFS